MAYGHETFHGQGQSTQSGLEAERQSTWAAYQELKCAPGWTQASINAAAAAARAQYQLDKARGYR